MALVRSQRMVCALIATALLLLSATCIVGTTTITTKTTIDIHARLVYAASQCDRPAVERILSDAPHAIRGLSVDGSGTALHAVARAASTDACLDTAAALLRAGIDPLALDGAGLTAVDVARDTDAQRQRPDRPPMGLFLAAAASGERAHNMRSHGPLVDDSAVPPPSAA
ncbi:Ankyrin repeat incomplete domain containing protein [Pandoravirus macleodensis]|uniref:Ankyrin repeat incomplete domain containing protein n=1 Tax=Pandoravirus macleodensis TaxID=2107707 RepID=A0A2U7UFK6_9VIRU|nr:Ankyrin repeat incomplete domain containing protein [Pandoravirus macleodensis]AVK77090.1 Ankyrin repeat incomplete domain containing protein [Pandoravirus macleodensis]